MFSSFASAINKRESVENVGGCKEVERVSSMLVGVLSEASDGKTTIHECSSRAVTRRT